MCQLQVAFVRQESDQSDSEILGECLQRRVWVQRVSYAASTVVSVTRATQPSVPLG